LSVTPTPIYKLTSNRLLQKVTEKEHGIHGISKISPSGGHPGGGGLTIDQRAMQRYSFGGPLQRPLLSTLPNAVALAITNYITS
jgi:hypothetical protein